MTKVHHNWRLLGSFELFGFLTELVAAQRTENGFLRETRFLGDLEGELRHLDKEATNINVP